MTFRGHVKNGLVVLDPPANLPEGIEVEVRLLAPPPPAQNTEAEGRSLYERLKGFAGAVQDLPPDAASNLKHDLYGYPKK